MPPYTGFGSDAWANQYAMEQLQNRPVTFRQSDPGQASEDAWRLAMARNAARAAMQPAGTAAAAGMTDPAAEAERRRQQIMGLTAGRMDELMADEQLGVAQDFWRNR